MSPQITVSAHAQVEIKPLSPQITVSAHAQVEIKPHIIGLGYTELEAGVCFLVLNGMKG